MIANKLKDEMEQKNNLAPSQFGFRKGKSTIDPMTRITDRISDIKKEFIKIEITAF